MDVKLKVYLVRGVCLQTQENFRGRWINMRIRRSEIKLSSGVSREACLTMPILGYALFISVVVCAYRHTIACEHH